MNKFLHPRNPYRNRPDFTALAKEFPDELAGAFKDGKFDFSDRRNSVKLSKCLLRKDFGLDIEFPPGSLAPSLTLKLNYLLWIQDLLADSSRCSSSTESSVVGMDVGCGGAVLFPALAVRVCDWSMIGVESEASDVQVANDNVKRNASLCDRVTIVDNPDKSFILKPSLQGSRVDFTMCNPPFYDEQEYTDQVSLDQELAGRRHEMSYPGGELAFVLKMIDESREVSDKVAVFTTMLGHKKNLGPLKKRLREIAEKPKLVSTEFCQGKTMRWALAWTFDPNVHLEAGATAKSEFAKSKAKKRGAEPFVLDLGDMILKEVHAKVKDLVECDLSAKDVEIDPIKGFCFRLNRPTWRNQRAKKRRKMATDGQDSSSVKSSDDVDSETLLQVKVQVLEPTDSNRVLKFTCDTGACTLGRGGLYELVQYFRNKLCPIAK